MTLPPSARLGRAASSRAALPQEWKTNDAAGVKPLTARGTCECLVQSCCPALNGLLCLPAQTV